MHDQGRYAGATPGEAAHRTASPGVAPRILLVKCNSSLAGRIRDVAPRAEIVAVPSALAGEAHVDLVDVVVLADRVTPAYLASPRLRWLHVVGAGVDGFSIPGLRAAPFVVTHKVGASIIPMAEHVMAQVLLIARRAFEYRSLQIERQWARHGQWPTPDLIQVHGKTLGLVGLGGAGLAIARRARAFGMRVIGVKRHAVGRLPNVDAIYPTDRLREMLGESDFVAIVAPLTDLTRHLIGEPELQAMKRTAYLINVSRGPIVDEAALIQALQVGRIVGASLDVFEREPLDAASPLWTLPNVVVTPHCGGVGPNLEREAAEEFLENLRRFVVGRRLRNQVNRDDIVTTFDAPSH